MSFDLVFLTSEIIRFALFDLRYPTEEIENEISEEMEIWRNRKGKKKEEIENQISEESAIGRNRKGKRREEDEGEKSGIGKKGGRGVEREDIGEGDPR
jgi:hypothetical protein